MTRAELMIFAKLWFYRANEFFVLSILDDAAMLAWVFC